MMAIEIYTERNEVCHASLGWNGIIDNDLVGISKNLPKHYTTYREIAPRLVTFYRDSMSTRRMGKKQIADRPSAGHGSQLERHGDHSAERAFEQGQSRQPHMAPTPGRGKAMSNVTPFNASDSPIPAPAPKKTTDCSRRCLPASSERVQPRALRAPRSKCRKGTNVLEKAHVEGYFQLVQRTISTCFLSKCPIESAKTKYIHNMPPPCYIAMVYKFYYSTQRNQSLICHCLHAQP